MHEKHHDTLHFPVVLALAFILLGMPAYMNVQAQATTGAGPAGTTYSNGYYYYSNGYAVPARSYYTTQAAPSAVPASNNYQTPRYVGTPAPTVSSPNAVVSSCYTFSSDLRLGSRGNDVVALQRFLLSKGYQIYGATGFYGTQTVAAVRSYQAANGISENGYVGPLTRARLNAGCGTPSAPSPTAPTPDETVPMSVTCSATVSNSGTPGVRWTAQVTGGRAAHQYSWSAYNDVKSYGEGSTASPTFRATYGSHGLKQAVVRVVDASGVSASATCNANVPAYSGPSSSVDNTTTAQVPLEVACTAVPSNSGTPSIAWAAASKGTAGQYQYSWNFYNDVSAYLSGTQLPNVSVTYASPGAKQAVVRMTDASGRTVSGSCTGNIPQQTASQPSAGVAQTQTGTNGIGWNYNPGLIQPGAQFTLYVINTGTRTWGPGHDLGLSASDLSTNFQFVSLAGTAPGAAKVVTFTAPQTPGNYVLRAVQQNVEWFGQHLTITVQ